MSQYLSKYLFNKYEYEAIFATSQYGLSVRIFMNPELVSDVVDDSKTTMTILRIICNYIIDTFGKCSILPEEAMHNIGKAVWRKSMEDMNMRMIRVWNIIVLASGIYMLTVLSPLRHTTLCAKQFAVAKCAASVRSL